MDLQALLNDGLNEIIGLDSAELAGVSLLDEGVIDSLSMINLVQYFENTTGKKIDSKQMSTLDFVSTEAIEAFLTRVIGG